MHGDPEELCDACGGTVRLRGGPGRFINYRRGVRLEIPSDLETLTCDDCGDIMLDGPTTEAIERRLAPVYEIKMLQPRSMQIFEIANDLPANSLATSAGRIEIRGGTRRDRDSVPPNAPPHAT
jgi:hypothetical protein